MICKAFVFKLKHLLIIPPTLLTLVVGRVNSALAQSKFYSPIALPPSNEIRDKLTENDIPTGLGGFARDYLVKLNKGDNVAIDLTSDSFDAMVMLLAADGTTISENDDGPDGTTNSLLFTRVNKTGTYVVRVRAFGETGVGNFKLKVTRLRPA
jgi:Bacterial pre-peptidase C-terminal domain